MKKLGMKEILCGHPQYEGEIITDEDLNYLQKIADKMVEDAEAGKITGNMDLIQNMQNILASDDINKTSKPELMAEILMITVSSRVRKMIEKKQ